MMVIYDFKDQGIQGFQSGPVPGTFTRLRSCIVPAEITEPPKISGGQNQKYDGQADLLNQYFCSITSINDSNREPPNVVPRTHAILSNIDVNIQDRNY
jgi:hypothetical protein